MTAHETILKTIGEACQVPNLVPLLVSSIILACVATAGAVASLVWWARGVVTWKDYTSERAEMAKQMEADRALVAQAIATLRNDMNARIERAEEVIHVNSRDAIVEARDAVKKVDEHVSRFEAVIDKVVEAVGNIKLQVASLAAIIAAKLP